MGPKWDMWADYMGTGGDSSGLNGQGLGGREVVWVAYRWI